MGPSCRARRNGDDASAFPLLHSGPAALDRQKGRCEIAVDRRAPSVFRYLFKRSGPRDATSSVRDQNVNRAGGVLGLEAYRFDVVESWDVTRPRNAGSARPL